MTESPDLRSIRIFLTVCETLNMTEAARRLGITQSAVSHSVLSLERLVRDQVFDRQTRPMSLTPVGHALFEAAQRVDASFRTFHLTIDNMKAGKIPHLRIGLTSSLPGALIPYLTSAISEHVDRITIRTGLTPDLRASLMSGEIDAAVMINRQLDAHLVTYSALTEPYILAAPSSFGEIGSLSDLLEISKRLPFIRWIGGYMGRDIEAHLKRLRIYPPERFALDDRNAVMNTIDAGLGWAVITPLSAYDVWQHSTNIRLHPFPGAVFQHSLVAAHKPGQFGWMAERCAAMVRDIIKTRLLPDLTARSPWLRETIIFPQSTLHHDS
ncbi:LysR family transcriptional regulator [Agrobacterium sp. P15N1-A]|uniref:LysR family transcriptional regulator n=1 Tax=Agrobacterium sp. P15N1-A TaxID=3342820 RepID=UPI0037DD7E32